MPGNVAATAATALALLHLWGVDTAVDSQLVQLLTELQLLPPPLQQTGGCVELPNGLRGPSNEDREQRQASEAAEGNDAPCVLPALVSSSGVTLATPPTQQRAATASEQRPSQQQERQRQRQCQPLQQPCAVPAMLRHSPTLVSQRLLAIAALSRRLIVSGQLSEAAVRHSHNAVTSGDETGVPPRACGF